METDFAAFSGQLDRKVALKILHSQGGKRTALTSVFCADCPASPSATRDASYRDEPVAPFVKKVTLSRRVTSGYQCPELFLALPSANPPREKIVPIARRRPVPLELEPSKSSTKNCSRACRESSGETSSGGVCKSASPK